MSVREFSIGTFASLAGVNVETIRFYQRLGLIREPTRSFGRIRRYHADDVARVRFVKSAQNLGFTLDEIAGLHRLEDGTHCDEARAAAEEKLASVRTKLADLQRIEAVLGELVEECCASTGDVRCPLIGALQHESGNGTAAPISKRRLSRAGA